MPLSSSTCPLQLDHSTNAPFRGGKATMWEGGFRVMAFVSGGALPAARRGTTWSGVAHSSDWLPTLVPDEMAMI